MDGTFLATVLAALLGACAALCGVLITQRSERKKAHADRVNRVQAYGTVYGCVEERGNALSKRLVPAPERLTPNIISAADSALPPPDTARLRLVGSTRVVNTYEEAESALGRVAERLETQSSRGEERAITSSNAISEALTALGNLERALTRETRGD